MKNNIKVVRMDLMENEHRRGAHDLSIGTASMPVSDSSGINDAMIAEEENEEDDAFLGKKGERPIQLSGGAFPHDFKLKRVDFNEELGESRTQRLAKATADMHYVTKGTHRS